MKKLLLLTGWAHGPASLQPLADRLSKIFDVQILSGIDVLAGRKIPDVEFSAGWSLGGLLAMEHLPDSQLRLFLGEGHAVALQNPDLVAEQMKAFLA